MPSRSCFVDDEDEDPSSKIGPGSPMSLGPEARISDRSGASSEIREGSTGLVAKRSEIDGKGTCAASPTRSECVRWHPSSSTVAAGLALLLLLTVAVSIIAPTVSLPSVLSDKNDNDSR